jgi:LytS/YehU family sensor histidine kinase
MLELLSSILRQVLQSKRRHEVTLEEELRFIEQYLAIEEVRFSDRLQIRWAIDPALRDALVPEFILQPLVENAVRHGIAKRTETGVIHLTAHQSDDRLVLTVKDNGPGYRPNSNHGVGLANTRARLATLYGTSGKLEVLNADDGGTVATVSFQLRRRADG